MGLASWEENGGGGIQIWLRNINAMASQIEYILDDHRYGVFTKRNIKSVGMGGIRNTAKSPPVIADKSTPLSLRFFVDATYTLPRVYSSCSCKFFLSGGKDVREHILHNDSM